MNKLYFVLAQICISFISLTACAGVWAETENAGGAPDYSRKRCWMQIPEITKDIDTFYIYSTVYVESSFEEGAPDYAPLDNLEMLMGALGEYVTNASVYEDSTNVFVPYYRQAGMRYAGEVSEKTGDIGAALSGMPYNDISAALDCYFKNYNNGRPFIIAGHSQARPWSSTYWRTTSRSIPSTTSAWLLPTSSAIPLRRMTLMPTRI